MNLKAWLLSFLIVSPQIAMAVVGESEPGSEQVACSVSICKKIDGMDLSPVYSSSMLQQECMNPESKTTTWVREEQVGNSEEDVRYTFQRIYGHSEDNGNNSFDTLVKLNWDCSKDRNLEIYTQQSTARPLYVNSPSLSHVDPKFRWESHSYDADSGIHTFGRLGYRNGNLYGYLSSWERSTTFICGELGFVEGVSIELGSYEGKIVYWSRGGDFTYGVESNNQLIDEIQCRGTVGSN